MVEVANANDETGYHGLKAGDKHGDWNEKPADYHVEPEKGEVLQLYISFESFLFYIYYFFVEFYLHFVAQNEPNECMRESSS